MGVRGVRDAQLGGKEGAVLECAAADDGVTNLDVGQGDALSGGRLRLAGGGIGGGRSAEAQTAVASTAPERGGLVDGDDLLDVVETKDGELEGIEIDGGDLAGDVGLAEVGLGTANLFGVNHGEEGGVESFGGGVEDATRAEAVADLDVCELGGLAIVDDARVVGGGDLEELAADVFEGESVAADGGDGAAEHLASGQTHIAIVLLRAKNEAGQQQEQQEQEAAAGGPRADFVDSANDVAAVRRHGFGCALERSDLQIETELPRERLCERMKVG